MTKAPSFSSGNCFMIETLNHTEAEVVGELVYAEILRLEAEENWEARTLRRALAKIDYPMPDPFQKKE